MKQTLFSMKRVIRLCAAGRIFILITIFLGVLSIVGNSNLLFMVTALLLGVMLSSGIVGRSNIRDAELSVCFADEQYAEIPGTVYITLKNRGTKRAVFLLEVEIEGHVAFFPIIQPGESVTKSIQLASPKRGRHLFSDVELSSIYPFKFFIRYWPVGQLPECVVFPKPLKGGPGTLFFYEEPLEKTRPNRNKEEEDIIGVRAYVEGDPMKRVHWKSSARTGSLKTRLYEGEQLGEGVVVDLDRLLLGDVERGLSLACFMIKNALERKQAIGMKYRNQVYFPENTRHSKLNLLTLLALHDGGDYHEKNA